MSNPQWLTWAQKIQSIAQAGLTYGKRYEQLRHIALEIVREHTNLPADLAINLFASESGYPTPKVDVRAVVFDSDGRMLFVRETTDGLWSLPGGWSDIGAKWRFGKLGRKRDTRFVQ